MAILYKYCTIALWRLGVEGSLENSLPTPLCTCNRRDYIDSWHSIGHWPRVFLKEGERTGKMSSKHFSRRR